MGAAAGRRVKRQKKGAGRGGAPRRRQVQTACAFVSTFASSSVNARLASGTSIRAPLGARERDEERHDQRRPTRDWEDEASYAARFLPSRGLATPTLLKERRTMEKTEGGSLAPAHSSVA